MRDLFKYYSERLYKTHHLSDEETATQLEKQANVIIRNDHMLNELYYIIFLGIKYTSH